MANSANYSNDFVQNLIRRLEESYTKINTLEKRIEELIEENINIKMEFSAYKKSKEVPADASSYFESSSPTQKSDENNFGVMLQIEENVPETYQSVDESNFQNILEIEEQDPNSIEDILEDSVENINTEKNQLMLPMQNKQKKRRNKKNEEINNAENKTNTKSNKSNGRAKEINVERRPIKKPDYYKSEIIVKGRKKKTKTNQQKCESCNVKYNAPNYYMKHLEICRK